MHQSRWRPTRRKVAGACVLEGLSIREAAERLKLSPYTVRKHKEAIDALCEEIPSAGDIP
ncbi:MAG: response regulator transcription factor [Phycisphaerales bacterium]|nr:response regulator transcription factor [Phycisphaerales bacterium]